MTPAGHGSGNDGLRRVAGAIAGAVRRAGDVVARHGGEEFVLILPGTTVEGALVIAERIGAAVAVLGIEHRAAPVGHRVTISVAAADAALHRAKGGGRDRACLGEVQGFAPPDGA